MNWPNSNPNSYLLSAKATQRLLLLGAMLFLVSGFLVYISRPPDVVFALVFLGTLILIAIPGIVRQKYTFISGSIIAYLSPLAYLGLIITNGSIYTPYASALAMWILIFLPIKNGIWITLALMFIPPIVFITAPEEVSPLFLRIVYANACVILTIAYLGYQNHLANERLKASNEKLADLNASLDKANMTKSRFLANMSHEIRTPLNGLYGSLQIIEQNKSNETLLDKYTKLALTSYNSVIGIVNDILDMTRINEGKLVFYPKPGLLAESIVSVFSELELLAKEKGILLKYQISPKEKNVTREFDEIRVLQVVRNLVSNAIKFTDQGEVLVTFERGDQTDQVLISVKDTGVGIPEDKLDLIFEVFKHAESSRQTERSGTGLGLAITKRLVEMMNGEINIRSTVGQGSTFTVMLTLPISKSITASAGTNEIVEFKPAKILLAEDVSTNRLVFKNILREQPYVVDMAENGETAVEMAMKNNYDVIFMDIMMPKMDGIQALKILKENGHNKPIIACTANVMKEDVDRYYQIGFDLVIHKPYKRDELNDVIQKAISG